MVYNSNPRHPVSDNDAETLPDDGTTLAAPVKPFEKQPASNVIISAQAPYVATHTVVLNVSTQMLLDVGHHGLAPSSRNLLSSSSKRFSFCLNRFRSVFRPTAKFPLRLRLTKWVIPRKWNVWGRLWPSR